jgi:hypothetical protein
MTVDGCLHIVKAQHEETERAAAEMAQAQAELAAVRKRQLEQATAGEFAPT